MFGFTTFSGSPFASVGSPNIVERTASIYAIADLMANANVDWNGVTGNIVGVAEVNVFGDIAGSGWVRQNPNTDEWDYDKSSDWNKIK